MSGAGFKPQAAARALEEVKPGMRLGLGTGSTAAAFVDQLGALVADGLDVLCVPTSEATDAQAKALGIPLTTLDETPCLDLTVDGADEIDPALRLIKGGGGALLREKIVAAASDRLFIIADDSKLVETLGAFPLPVEVVPFGLAATHAMVEARAEAVGCIGEITLRRTQSGQPFVTDGGHHILDCAFGRIPIAEDLALAFAEVPGVVEHGLFLGLADCAAVAGQDGVRLLECPGR